VLHRCSGIAAGARGTCRDARPDCRA
jgi:hypothetical protein